MIKLPLFYQIYAIYVQYNDYQEVFRIYFVVELQLPSMDSLYHYQVYFLNKFSQVYVLDLRQLFHHQQQD